MKNIVYLLLVVLNLVHAQSNEKLITPFETESLKIEAISEKIFKHISYLETESFGNVPCNGMIYINENEAIIFDTPTNDLASAELIKWITSIQKKKIKAVVVTHFHIDCLGGLKEFHKNKTETYGSELTIKLAKKNNKILPKNSFEKSLKINVDDELVFANYFGKGHTFDNVVGYIPSEKTLFGGCLIKAMNASKGNLEDADVMAWSQTIEKIKLNYPNIDIVIPGHGKAGGKELLDYTFKLFTDN